MGVHESERQQSEERAARFARDQERTDCALASITEAQGDVLDSLYAHKTCAWGTFTPDISVKDAFDAFPPNCETVYYRQGCAGYVVKGDRSYDPERAEVHEIGPIWVEASPFPNIGNTKQGGCSEAVAHWYSRQGDQLWRLEFALPTSLVNFEWVSGNRASGRLGRWDTTTGKLAMVVGRHTAAVSAWGSGGSGPGRVKAHWPAQGGGTDPGGSIPTREEMAVILTCLRYFRLTEDARGWADEESFSRGFALQLLLLVDNVTTTKALGGPWEVQEYNEAGLTFLRGQQVALLYCGHARSIEFCAEVALKAYTG